MPTPKQGPRLASSPAHERLMLANMAIKAALVPTMPPPNTSTLAGLTPGTPPSKIPRPP